MKTVFHVLTLAALLAVKPALASPPRIAVVDMKELFKHYHRASEVQRQLNIERARIQKDNNERLARLRDLEISLTDLRRDLDDPAQGEGKRQRLFQEWQVRQQEGITLDRERREFLQRRNQMLNEKMVQRMTGLLEEIRWIVEEHARAGDYDFIYDKSGLSTSQVPFLLYAKDAADITGFLLREINRERDEAPMAAGQQPALPQSIMPQADRFEERVGVEVRAQKK